uniref:Uncharacterized protein n=1 Tax=Acrobeloides nanus TaxID=290746 RepID=A0A914CVW8_9BILA
MPISSLVTSISATLSTITSTTITSTFMPQIYGNETSEDPIRSNEFQEGPYPDLFSVDFLKSIYSGF